MSGDYIEHPVTYAARKCARLRARWDGAMGTALRQWGPRLWPGVPLTALLGLSASSEGMHEAGGPPDYATGLYGVEGDRLPSLCAEAAKLLDRDVNPAVERGAYRDDVEAQVITGLLTYQRHREALLAKIPRALWEGEPVSSWELRATAAAYSSGGGRVAPVLAELAPELVALPVAERWPHAAERVAHWPEARINGVSVAGKWRAAFWHLRADQRLMCGLAVELAENGGREADWFAPWSDEKPELVAALQALADRRGP